MSGSPATIAVSPAEALDHLFSLDAFKSEKLGDLPVLISPLDFHEHSASGFYFPL